MTELRGIPASPGIAIGKAYLLQNDDIVIERREVKKDRVKQEIKRFNSALKKTAELLDATEKKALASLGKKHAKLIDAHKLILEDPLIKQDVCRYIEKEFVSAEYALSQILAKADEDFNKIKDEFFRDRRHDLFDVGKRIMQALLKSEDKSVLDIKEPAIVVAHNLYPSETINLRDTATLGFCIDVGGKTSHTALLAQSMQIPAVVGLSDISARVKDGETVILDGDEGLVILSPSPAVLEQYRKAKRQAAKEDRLLEAVRELPTITKDRKQIKIMVNLDVRDNAKLFKNVLADGVGLLRTESLFLGRSEPPLFEEQLSIYEGILKHTAPAPLVIRLADIGGDKISALGFDKTPEETNPFMGLRGVRLFLRYPFLLRAQLKAAMLASVKGDVKIMIPMVSSVSEVRAVKEIMAAVYSDLISEGFRPKNEIELGVMIEVPSAAMTLDGILPEIDFVSIGTNDLIQYLLAVDRGNQEVAGMYQSAHPSVIRMIHLIVQTAHKKGKPVSVCGEMASDTKMIPLLLGFGVDVLSVSPGKYLKTKSKVRSLFFEKCCETANTVLGMYCAEDVEAYLESIENENP